MILYQQVYTDSVSHFQHPNPDFFIISMLLYCLAFTESKNSSTHFILSLFTSFVLVASILAHLHRAYLLQPF